MKILSCVFPITLGNPIENAKKIVEIADKNESDIYLFPAFVLTGISCGKLVSYENFKAAVEEALDMLCKYTEDNDKVIVTSSHSYGNIAIYDGDINKTGSFKFKNKSIAISKSGDEKADIVLIPTAMPGYPCIKNDVSEFCADASKKNNCVVAVANCGYGESSADNVFKGIAGIFKNGIITAFMAQDAPETIIASADYEKADGIIYARPNRVADKIPYYGKNDEKLYLNDLFLLQVQALYTRLKSSGINKVAVNVSGGLDSTLSLLVAHKTIEVMGLPSENIIGLSLPCFATTQRTNTNAKKLMEELKITAKEINIKESVSLHLKDIGHDGKTEDVTYENAQARERAQILFDICNMHNALALGTGDMSESALGFCTFAGDTLSHYNVNATVPKTLVKETVRFIASGSSDTLKEVLMDIAETPISPELKENQNTEDILGPYLLHDFIMYYFAKHNMLADDIRNYAFATFNEYDDDVINNTLDVFFTRYSKSQFKRSSASEGANLIGFTLPYIPADCNFDYLK